MIVMQTPKKSSSPRKWASNSEKIDRIYRKSFHDENEKENLIKKRYILAVLGFFGFFIAHSLRATLSVAVLDMAKTESVDDSREPTFYEIFWPIAKSNVAYNSTHDHPLEKKWTTELEGYILSSFFLGYVFTLIPAAWLTTQFGGRLFFGVGIGLCALLHLLVPIASFIGPTCIIILRIMQGIVQGLMFPAMHKLWSKWAPPFERSRLAMFSLSGAYVGSVVSFSIGGIVIRHFNWQLLFYMVGIFGVCWAFLWFYIVSESPAEHPTIDRVERFLIESSLTKSTTITAKDIPWKKIFSSTPVWAIIVVHFAENWGYYTMLTEMPRFFSEVLHFRIDKAGFTSALPYFAMAIILYVSSNTSDRLIMKKYSYTKVRKFFCCTGILLQCIFMNLITTSQSSVLVVVYVTLTIGLGGMCWSAFGVNHLDIGAHYANVLIGISNTFATLPGIISPTLTGFLTKEKTKEEWNDVFFISAMFYLIGGLTYGIFGTAELQPWADSSSTSTYTQFDNEIDSICTIDEQSFQNEKSKKTPKTPKKYHRLVDSISVNSLINSSSNNVSYQSAFSSAAAMVPPSEMK